VAEPTEVAIAVSLMDNHALMRRVAFLFLCFASLAGVAAGTLSLNGRAHAAVVRSRSVATRAELSSACYVGIGKCSLVPCVEFIGQAAELARSAVIAPGSPRSDCAATARPPDLQTQIIGPRNAPVPGVASTLLALQNRLSAMRSGPRTTAPRR
jgi:hypothetical protein